MKRFANRMSRGAKLAFGVLALGAVALPAAGAFASAEDPTAELSSEQVDEARQIFMDWSCGACHALGDAKAFGQAGPSLDGNGSLDHDFIVKRVTNGQGAMPGFGGQLSKEEIELLASYIIEKKK